LLDGQKDVSLPKIEQFMSQLNVTFNSNAIKMINEVCKCDPLEGVSALGDEILNEEKQSKYSQ
jgi:hypothetical protein